MLMPSFSIWSVISFSMSHFSGQVQKTKTKAELPDMPVIEIVQMLMQEDEFSTVKNCCWAGSTWSLPFKLKVRLNPSCFRMNTQLEYDHSAALKSFVFFYFVYYWVHTQHSAVSSVGLSVIKGLTLTTVELLSQQLHHWKRNTISNIFTRTDSSSSRSLTENPSEWKVCFLVSH